jgi:redox-sensitive bicupin YhaK (pirin superfamily)
MFAEYFPFVTGEWWGHLYSWIMQDRRDTAAGSIEDGCTAIHLGLSTVSYLFGVQVTHRIVWGKSNYPPGEVNWMTAGSGIAHSERFEDPSAPSGSLK